MDVRGNPAGVDLVLPVHRGDEGVDRSHGDVAVHAHAPVVVALVVGDDHVGRGQGVRVGLQGVLLVVHKLVLDVGVGDLQHVAHGVQGAVAPGAEVEELAADGQGDVGHGGAPLPQPGDVLQGDGLVLVQQIMKMLFWTILPDYAMFRRK